MKIGSITYNAIVILVGRGPMSADDFGGDLWRGRKRGRTTSSGGGGDYAAQMLLGRLRRAGLAEHAPGYEGATRWQATAKGRNELARCLANSGAPGEVRKLRAVSSNGGRGTHPRDLELP